MTLDKETYQRWISKFFTMDSLMRAAAWLACLYTKGMDTFNMNIKKEAWGLILRSAQRHFNEGIAATSDAQIHGIKVMTLRLQSNTARELFGTKFLPVIGGDDPMLTSQNPGQGKQCTT